MAPKPTDPNRIYLTPSEITKLVVDIVVHNYLLPDDAQDASYINLMIWGNTGIGKTWCINNGVKMAREKLSQLGHDARLPLIPWAIADKAPEEATGYPKPINDVYFRRIIPEDFVIAKEEAVVVFLDEIAQGCIEQQNVARSITLGQTVGTIKFKHGSTVICASNPMEDRSGTRVMPTHQRDVLTHVWMRPDHKESALWMISHGFAPEISSFIYVHGAQYLNDLDTSKDALACPSSRSWTTVNEIFQLSSPEHLRKAAISGQVGAAACGAFYTHMLLGKYMPDCDEILAGRGVMVDEKRSDVVYMTMCALATKVAAGTMLNLVSYLKRLKHKEFSSFCMNMALKRSPDLRSAQGVMNWMIENESDLIL